MQFHKARAVRKYAANRASRNRNKLNASTLERICLAWLYWTSSRGCPLQYIHIGHRPAPTFGIKRHIKVRVEQSRNRTRSLGLPASCTVSLYTGEVVRQLISFSWSAFAVLAWALISVVWFISQAQCTAILDLSPKSKNGSFTPCLVIFDAISIVDLILASPYQPAIWDEQGFGAANRSIMEEKGQGGVNACSFVSNWGK